MAANLGSTALPRSRRACDPMTEHDRLPAPLRAWLSAAALPWSAKSARRAYDKALKKTGAAHRALAELSRIEARQIARDAAAVWGEGHPAAMGGGCPAAEGPGAVQGRGRRRVPGTLHGAPGPLPRASVAHGTESRAIAAAATLAPSTPAVGSLSRRASGVRPFHFAAMAAGSRADAAAAPAGRAS